MQLIGKRFEDNAKSGLEGIAFEADGDVLFKWRDPTTSIRVNSDEVKKQYPQSKHPSLYNETPVKGSVSVTVPYSKTEILLPELVGASDDATDFPDFGQVPFKQTAEPPIDPFA